MHFNMVIKAESNGSTLQLATFISKSRVVWANRPSICGAHKIMSKLCLRLLHKMMNGGNIITDLK